MRWTRLLLLTFLGGELMTACSLCPATPVAALKPFVAEPLGGPCLADTDCAAGQCTGGNWAGDNLCSIACDADGGACPSGMACALSWSTNNPVCMPTCTADVDCIIGGRAQSCLSPSDPSYPRLTQGDGGVLVCGELDCTENNLQLHGECGGVLCPSGFHCVVGLPDGGSPNAGFCQQ